MINQFLEKKIPTVERKKICFLLFLPKMDSWAWTPPLHGLYIEFRVLSFLLSRGEVRNSFVRRERVNEMFALSGWRCQSGGSHSFLNS